MLWHIGNTTVRTPYRLRDALIALKNSNLNGNISGKNKEQSFAGLLHQNQILNSPKFIANGDVSDLGRKWRSALSQLGFITPKLTRKLDDNNIDSLLTEITKDEEDLSGRPYEITPNGYRLINSESVAAQQECFLRSLCGYKIPSPIETNYNSKEFSPLIFILNLLFKIEENKCDRIYISFHEFALFVQTSSPDDEVNEVINKILHYRNDRDKAKGKIKAYDRDYYDKIAKEIGKKTGTLKDYADLSFRYLKATGIFRSSGRGIALNLAKKELANLLRKENSIIKSDKDYLLSLWKGAKLPTDNIDNSRSIVNDLLLQLKEKGEEVLLEKNLNLPDLENKRHELEEKIFKIEENCYANEQSNQIDEIIAWMEAIPSRGSAKLPNGDLVSIPQGEGPVYLEWIIWRAFLAINSLQNAPWESRRFKIDQDFLPVSCAPGNGPDMIFEFKDIIIVVEVTLTSSSRQEAAEGEPVRRHVAQYAEKYSKDVYGLFIALEIDSNTAHTFRSGDWYLKNDNKINLEIVPVSLEDFMKFLIQGKNKINKMPELLHNAIIQCRAKANQDAPQWKKSISSIINKLMID